MHLDQITQTYNHRTSSMHIINPGLSLKAQNSVKHITDKSVLMEVSQKSNNINTTIKHKQLFDIFVFIHSFISNPADAHRNKKLRLLQ